MKHERDFETMLVEALHRRGAPAPFSIDLSDRLMARVAALGPPPRTDMDVRQFVRWAVAASVAGAAIATTIAWQGPGLVGAVSYFGHAISTASSTALKLQAPAEALASTSGRVLLAFVASARVLARTLEPLQPFAQASLAATTAAVLIVTTLIVGRDARAHAVEKERA